MFAKDIVKTPSLYIGKNLPDFRGKTDMTQQPLRVVDVDVLGSHIQITAPDQRILRGKETLQEFTEPAKPGKFIGKLRIIPFSSLGDVSIYYGHRRELKADKPFLIGRTIVR